MTTSRAFAIGGPNQPRAMLPVIDMCNHHGRDANCDLRRESDGAMVLEATQAVPPDHELLLNYGALDNHTLLLDYGFVEQVQSISIAKLVYMVSALVSHSPACARASSLD